MKTKLDSVTEKSKRMPTLERTEAAFDLIRRAGLEIRDGFTKCHNYDYNIKILILIIATDMGLLLEKIARLNSYIRKENEKK